MSHAFSTETALSKHRTGRIMEGQNDEEMILSFPGFCVFGCGLPRCALSAAAQSAIRNPHFLVHQLSTLNHQHSSALGSRPDRELARQLGRSQTSAASLGALAKPGAKRQTQEGVAGWPDFDPDFAEEPGLIEPYLSAIPV